MIVALELMPLLISSFTTWIVILIVLFLLSFVRVSPDTEAA